MPKKPYPPTLKEKNRYMLFKIHSKKKFTRDEVIRAIWRNTLQNLGSFNTSRSSLWIMDYDTEHQKGILRTNNKKQLEVKTSLTLLKEIKGEKAFISVGKVSGTLRKIRENIEK